MLNISIDSLNNFAIRVIISIMVVVKYMEVIMYKIFLKAIYAGLLIGIAALAYLSAESQVIGAILFSFGLMVIVATGYYLYTGKVGYLVSEKQYLSVLGLTILGNAVGTFSIAMMARIALPGLITKAELITANKLSNNLLQVLILAILCGMMMYLGVEGYKRTKNDSAKVFIVSAAVVIFILSKFEHSIANMVYFSLAGSFDLKTLLYLAVMIIGNGLGAMLLCYIDQIVIEKENANF